MNLTRRLLPLLLAPLAISAVHAAVIPAVRASTSARGAAGNGDSERPSVSADGRYVAFHSAASNLVPKDRNDRTDVFVFDAVTRKIRSVSVTSDGAQADGLSQWAAISANGRFVAFESTSTNLDPREELASYIYVHDLETGQTELVSIGLNDAVPNNWCSSPAISGDGRFVAYVAFADNLVPGDTNNRSDVFVFDRLNETTVRASLTHDDVQPSQSSSWPAISADGRYVAFHSTAAGMVPGDTFAGPDFYVRDLQEGTTEQVSVAPHLPGAHGLATSGLVSLSPDGRFVVFATGARLVPEDLDQDYDIYLRDRELGLTERVSLTNLDEPANGFSTNPTVSADGRYVAFASTGPAIVDGPLNFNWHVYVRDRERGTTERVSLLPGVAPSAEFFSTNPVIAADGLSVAFAQRWINPQGTRPSFHQVYTRKRLAELPEPPIRLRVQGTLTFPTTEIGATRAKTVVIKNLGPGTARGSVLPLAAPFSVTAGLGGFTLLPGAQHTVAVTFAPTVPGRAESEVVLDLTNAGSQDLRLPVRGKGR